MTPVRYILITGSTDGIGLQTAKNLLQNPENFVILHGRSADKCRKATDSVGVASSGATDFVVADFEDLKQVAKMADDVRTRFPKLNVLLCNAGIKSPPTRQETKDGLELTFQVM